jgi:hypothetical protein
LPYRTLEKSGNPDTAPEMHGANFWHFEGNHFSFWCCRINRIIRSQILVWKTAVVRVIIFLITRGQFFLLFFCWSRAGWPDEFVNNSPKMWHNQVCQILLCTWYPNRKKCTKWTQNIPNDKKISQMSVKYSKWQ